MVTTRQRRRASRAPAQPSPRSDTTTIAIQVPKEDWHRFTVALAVDAITMQDWVNQRVNALLGIPWDQLKEQPYARVPRKKGPTRQIIARVPTKNIHPLQLRLAQLAIPMSWWLYKEIQKYTKGLKQKLEQAEAKGLLNPTV